MFLDLNRIKLANVVWTNFIRELLNVSEINIGEFSPLWSVSYNFFPCVKCKESPTHLTLIGKNKKPFKIEINFIQWLVGFSDAEGNFHISLKNFKNNNYKKIQLTFLPSPLG